mmetsp:Transcript_50560/g.75551  ORF Transcript_50560/g.75551 Transcript_50560/m.75551 type:complete len:80 (-) Transcript_50560:748-987(-)
MMVSLLEGRILIVSSGGGMLPMMLKHMMTLRRRRIPMNRRWNAGTMGRSVVNDMMRNTILMDHSDHALMAIAGLAHVLL